ncbi:hypothetical protein YC2023_011073 [Brassica napus]
MVSQTRYLPPRPESMYLHPRLSALETLRISQTSRTRNEQDDPQYRTSDEELKSSSEKEKGTRSKSVKNMQLRKTKEANQDLGAFKEGYLCNLRILTVKQLAIDSQLNQSKRRIGFIPKGVML